MRLYCLFRWMLLCFALGSTVIARAQEESSEGKIDRFTKFPERFFTSIQQKSSTMGDRLSKHTEKYLNRLARREAKLERKMSRIDTSWLKLAVNRKILYDSLSALNKTKPLQSFERTGGEYLPYIDSVKAGLNFLSQQQTFLNRSGIKSVEVTKALSQFNSLTAKLQQTANIRQIIKERQNTIRELVSWHGRLPRSVSKQIAGYNKEIFYYSQQIREYRELLNQPDRLLLKGLSHLNKLPAFATFMKEHSELAGLFNIPGNYSSSQAVVGLQTRSQVQALITNQLGGGPNAGQLFGQQISGAQTQLEQLKDKINVLGKGGGELEMPDFKPNNQKTKNFFQRLEYGTNIQSTQSSYLFPTTTDLGFAVGYKLNDKSVAGIGASYKIGWGKDLRHISISSQGLSVRSFLDTRLKGSFYASGGFEFNYQKPFNDIQQLENLDNWRQSGLVGMSKIISMKSKVFKKTRIQLLWDFLSYQQIPRTEPFKFRVGYNF